MNAETPIQRFAFLDLLIDRLKASGKPVPNDVANEYQALRAHADAVLTPEQNHAVLRHVREAQQGILAAEQRVVGNISAARQRSQVNLASALRNAGARQISRVANIGRDGKALNEDQLAEAVSKGKWTDPGRKHALDRAAERVQKQTGKRTTRKDITDILGTFGALMDDSRLMDKYLTDQCGDDEVRRAELRDSIETTWIRETMLRRQDNALMKRDPTAFKPKQIGMSEQERRKLDVADRVLAHAGPEFFVDRVSDESLNDPGSRGDTARAFALHDEGDRDPEVSESYADAAAVEQTAEQYDV